MAALPRPASFDLQFLRRWLQVAIAGKRPLIGADRLVWGLPDETGQQHDPDLIALRSRRGEDQFSKWAMDKGVECLHRCMGGRVKKPRDPEFGITEYDDDHLLRYISLVTTILASLLPVLSVVILY